MGSKVVNFEKAFLSSKCSLSKEIFFSFKIPAENFKVKIKIFICFNGNLPKDEVLKKTYAFSIFLYVKISKNIF